MVLNMGLSTKKLQSVRRQVERLGLASLPELSELFAHSTDLLAEGDMLYEGWGNMMFLRAWIQTTPGLELVEALKPLLDSNGWDEALQKAATNNPPGWFEEAWKKATDNGREKLMGVMGNGAPLENLKWAMAQGEGLPQLYLINALTLAVLYQKEDRIRLLLGAVECPWVVLPEVRKSPRAAVALSFLDRHWSESAMAGESALIEPRRIGSLFRQQLRLITQLTKELQLEQRLPASAPATFKPRF